MKKRVIVTHFTMKIIRTYLSITQNKKCYLLKNILAYCEYSPTSPFFLLLSEHKYWDNAATNSNSENARSRMVACTDQVKHAKNATFTPVYIHIFTYVT